MKFRSLFFALLALVSIVGIAIAAEDLLKAAPKCCNVILENEEIRVLDYVGKAGEKVGMHMHPDHVVYALTDGKVRFTQEDGSSKVVELKKGQAVFNKAGSHITENIGGNDIHVILVEITEELKEKTRATRNSDDDDSETYKVVVNSEGLYSIWPASRQNPMGWSDEGFTGSKYDCLDYIGGR